VARVTITITISKELSSVTATDIQAIIDWIQTNVVKKLAKEMSINMNMSVTL
jgi:hypothetical protein